jgi:hypothetical protein
VSNIVQRLAAKVLSDADGDVQAATEVMVRAINLASSKGPRILPLSPNTIGVRDSDNRAWQDGLVRGGK